MRYCIALHFEPMDGKSYCTNRDTHVLGGCLRGGASHLEFTICAIVEGVSAGRWEFPDMKEPEL